MLNMKRFLFIKKIKIDKKNQFLEKAFVSNLK